jgi:ribose transport system ATP-binding protein
MGRPIGLRIAGLSKRYGPTLALDEVSLEAAPGSIHALVGGNGSGKSTLIKVLAGVHTAEAGGRIEVGTARVAADRVTPAWARASGLSFVHQDLGLFDVLSVAENLAVGQSYPRSRGRIAWGRMRREAQATLDRLGIAVPADGPVGALRPAERTLVAIARALQGREDAHGGVLVLDEPTARLPESEAGTLLDALRRYAARGQTILYVSHRLEEILALAHRITVLRDGAVVAGEDAGRLDEPGLARLIVGHAVDRPARARRSRPGSAPVLELRGVCAGPLRDVWLKVGEREVLGVAGLVGSGRTSLLQAIYGALRPTTGTIVLDGRALGGASVRAAIRRGLSYVPEDRAADGAFLGLGAPENLSAADPGCHRSGPWFGHRRERAAAGAAMRAYAIRAPAVTAPLTALSGGNQQKVVVARWLQRSPRVLLLDEPTQGVDVGARADIHAHVRAAVDAGGAALVVSSDVDELLALSDRVVVLAGGRIVGEAHTEAIDRHWLAERVYVGATEVAA